MTNFKIAALIQAHHRPDLLQRLLERLQGPMWRCYVHLDLKTPLEPFQPFQQGVHYLEQRLKVRWAGFSQVAATLLLLRTAYADEANTHFYLMSGQCYPIHEDAEIVARLSRYGRADFIDIGRMPYPSKPLSRLTEWHFLDRFPYGRTRRRLQRIIGLWPARDVKRLLRGIEPHAGLNWWLFTRDTAEAMLAFLDREPWFERAFHYTHCADEMFFQTLFAHLGLRASSGCPTATRWVGNSSHPEPVDSESLASARRSGESLMIRKVADFHPADLPG